jgi:hypothetical protein
MADEEEKPIRVVDRRMFTPDGELRPEYRTEAEADFSDQPAGAPETTPESGRAGESSGKGAAPAEATGPAPAPTGPVEPASPEERAQAAPRSAFALIVQLLAMPAYAALGMMPDPASGRQRVDRTAAREMIDLLAALEQKTRGNLSFEESNFLSRVLYDLRLAFVEVSRPPGK